MRVGLLTLVTVAYVRHDITVQRVLG